MHESFVLFPLSSDGAYYNKSCTLLYFLKKTNKQKKLLNNDPVLFSDFGAYSKTCAFIQTFAIFLFCSDGTGQICWPTSSNLGLHHQVIR